MYVDPPSPRPPLNHTQTERLREWLARQFRAHYRNEIVSGCWFAMVAVAAHVVVIGIGTYIEVVFARLFGASRSANDWLWLVPACTLAAMYPLYFWRYRQPDAVAELSTGTIRVSQRRLHTTQLDPHEPVDRTIFRRLKLEIFLFPLWCVSRMFTHFEHARYARYADAWNMARVIALLYHENRRVQIHDLDERFQSPALADAVRSLEVQPGVLFFTDGQLALAINDELVHEVKKAAQLDEAG